MLEKISINMEIYLIKLFCNVISSFLAHILVLTCTLAETKAIQVLL